MSKYKVKKEDSNKEIKVEANTPRQTAAVQQTALTFPKALAGLPTLVPMEDKPFIMEVLKEYLDEKDAKDITVYASAILDKFGDYIKAIVMFGSRGHGVKKRKTSDIDVAILVDDTDVRRMTRAEVKEKLFARLVEMAMPISKKIHPQPYLLSEFWEFLLEANPVIYTLVRSGVIIYDTGFFMPFQMLLKSGHVKASTEAVNKHIELAEDILKLAENTMLTKITYDFAHAVISSAQAVLMELGYRPPVPNEVSKFVDEILVKELKLVDPKFVKIADDAVKLYKDVEHNERTTFTGEEYDKHLKEVKEFVDEMVKIIKKLRTQRGEDFKSRLSELKDEKREEVKVKRETDIDLNKNEIHNEEEIKQTMGQR